VRGRHFGLLFSLTIIPVWLWAGGGTQQQVPTTIEDFFVPGTQPFNPDLPGSPERIRSVNECQLCHGNYSVDHAPVDTWKASMMAQATRDPLFHACLAVAEQDAAFVGDLCLRCHSTRGWLEDRSTPTNGAALSGADFEGVTCHVCHRMVDPIYDPDINPPEDEDELMAIGEVPVEPHNGSYIIDREDRRRGPFDLDADYENFDYHEFRVSAFHREALLCATCHDVSNPVLERQGGPIPSPTDTYIPGDMDLAAAVDKYDQFPVERTFSEWANSAFAEGPIDMGGRFGGNNPLISVCQDCHMPDATGTGCNPVIAEVTRDDVPAHYFLGAGNWVLDAILELDNSNALYGPDEESGLTKAEVLAAQARNRMMLEKAADLDLSTTEQTLQVRVTNQTGHKLPTGYPEGRRMWIGVRLSDASHDIVAEFGGYDPDTAELDAESTKVYESVGGIDAVMADVTGLPQGESFHFVLNNQILMDNRIPPRGFTNAAFEAVQAAPIGYSYADDQFWDDTVYDLTCDVVSAEVGLYYQTSSKEYIEFLRDENVTNDRGDILHDLWEMFGKSPPVEMAVSSISMDCNSNGQLDGCDIMNGESEDADTNGVPDECECAIGGAAACCDIDADGVRDDNCQWCNCQDGLCTVNPIVFGDMGGAFGVCAPDGVPNVHDRNHALNCFASQNECDKLNIDTGGSFGSCCPDGHCNIHDANLALLAFTDSPCTCPQACGPAPMRPAIDETTVSVIADARVIRPGGAVDVRVLLDQPLHNLQSYQLHMAASGGHRGALQLESIAVEVRKDTAFAHAEDSFEATNVMSGQMLRGVGGPGSQTPARAYLATFRFHATSDAAGRFVIQLLHDGSAGDQTFLISRFVDAIEVTHSSAAVVHVQTHGEIVPRKTRTKRHD
jgi:hypothetical protein